MIADPFELLSAFVDGEAADPAALAEALATPGARDALISFVQLRAVVALDSAVPSRGFYAAMERSLPGRASIHPARWPRRISAGLAAAVLVGIGLFAGFVIRDRSDAAGDKNAPPSPAREVRFAEGVDWFRS